MTENFYTEQVDTKLYNGQSILIATLFGGPLAGGYLISENFRYLGEPEKAKQTWIFAILGLSVLLAILGFVQGSRIPSRIPWYVLPLGYTALTYLPMRWLQGARIKSHKMQGGHIHKGDRVFVICFVGAVATMVGLLIATILMQVAATTGDAG
jgi:hypothetical protein